MALDPKVWGPPYWFVLHTIAITYPLNPNEVTKKKYYDFIQNLPLFLPVSEIGNNFSAYLDKYPVVPYLDSRPSFMKWVHFIHNKINISIGLPELSMDEAMIRYYDHYRPKVVKNIEQRRRRERFVFVGIVLLVVILVGYLYNK
jgi:fumarate reductase subunit C